MIGRTALVALLIAVSGCDADAGEGASDPGAAKSPAVRQPTPPLPPGEELPPTAEERAARLRERQATGIEAARRAAEEQGGTACERAYAGMGVMAEATGRASTANADRLEAHRARFLTHCPELPEEVQLCLSPSYHVDHLQTCTQVMREHSTEVGQMRLDVGTP